MKGHSFACFSHKERRALLFENFIVQRIFYFPSAVGKPASHMSESTDGHSKMTSDGFKIQTVRRIRSEGHDRQRH